MEETLLGSSMFLPADPARSSALACLPLTGLCQCQQMSEFEVGEMQAPPTWAMHLRTLLQADSVGTSSSPAWACWQPGTAGSRKQVA